VFGTSRRKVRRAGVGCLAAMVLACSGLVSLPMLADPASAYPSTLSLSGHYPVAFIRCDFTDWHFEPNSTAFYQSVWTQQNPTGTDASLADWYHDISFGKMDLAGSAVLGWYHMTTPPLQWDLGGASNNYSTKWLSCINAAEAGGLGNQILNYKSLIVVTPQVSVTLTSPIPAQPALQLGQSRPAPVTTTVDNGASLPPAPFVLDLPNQTPGENVEVTNVQGNTVTLIRGYQNAQTQLPGPFAAVPTGTQVNSETSNDTANGVGPQTLYLENGAQNCATSSARCPEVFLSQPGSGTFTTFTAGEANLFAGLDNTEGNDMVGVGDSAHEVSHTLGFNHSRKLSSSTTDYRDCTDQMSYNYCGLKLPGLAGPPDGLVNLDALDLEHAGWVPSTAIFNSSDKPITQHTITLRALSDPAALSKHGFLDAHLPAAVPIEIVSGAASGPHTPPTIPPTCTGAGYQCVTSKYYSVEYRQFSGFDADLPSTPATTGGEVVLHLYAPDPAFNNLTYLVDSQPGAGTTGHPVALPNGRPMGVGQDFADPANHVYVAVNAINPATDSAQVSVAPSPITPTLTLSGPISGTAGSTVTLSARLAVGAAPVPGQTITLGIDDVLGGTGPTCAATTDLTGRGQCTVQLGGTQLTAVRTATFAGDQVYAPANAASLYSIWSASSTIPVGLSQTAPAIAASGGTVVAAFRQPSTGDVFITSNSGSGWSTATQVPFASTSFAPAVALDGGFPSVAWTDSATGDVEVSHAFTGWTKPVTVGQGLARSSAAPSMAWANGTFFVAWKGQTTDGIWYSQEGANATWSAEASVTNAATAYAPAIGAFPTSAAPVIVAWTTGTDTLNYSLLGFTGWTPVQTVPGGSDAAPSLGYEGAASRTFLAWKGTTAGQIYYSSTVGTGWSQEATVPGSLTLTSPAIAFSAATAAVAWTDKLTGAIFTASAATP
jgi:hypothetical protein